jgi:hypothetical protein
MYSLPHHPRELATLIRCKLTILLRFGTKGNRKNPQPRNQRGGEIQIRAIIPDRNKIARFLASYARAGQECASTEHLVHPDGHVVFHNACTLGAEGIVSKRLGSRYRSGRSPDWLKLKNPQAPAVRREAEEDWGR